MSRTTITPDFYVQFVQLLRRVERLERLSSAPKLKDVDTTGLTSAQIDEAVFASGPNASTNAQSADGLQISDTTNHLLLVRQAGKWFKTSTLTMIS